MNYFLLIVILGIAGGAWYYHQQDQQTIDTLQAQIADLESKTTATTTSVPGAAAASPRPAPVAVVQPIVPAKVIQPMNQSSAVDAAAQAAAAAARDPNDIGTITTLDGRTLTHCHVLKVEADGVTFNHDDGITKVLFPLLSPDVQKRFGYSPTQAVAQTEAQIQAQQAQAAINTNAPANP